MPRLRSPKETESHADDQAFASDQELADKKGRARGIEPPYGGITIRCLNRLATPATAKPIYITLPREMGSRLAQETVLADSSGARGPFSPPAQAPVSVCDERPRPEHGKRFQATCIEGDAFGNDPPTPAPNPARILATFHLTCLLPESPASSGAGAVAPSARGGPWTVRAPRARRLLPLAPVLLALAALAWSNPGPQDFAAFAGNNLTERLTKEVCRGTALPLVLSLLADNCPAMLAAQRPVLAALASAQSERLNLGLFSLYRTEIGGQRLLRTLQLPTYSVITLAAAGQFYVLQTSVQTNSPSSQGRR